VWRIRQLLEYRQDGSFVWLPRHDDARFNSTWAGRIAGCHTDKGYIKIGIDGIGYFAHRLVWKLHTGDDPEDMIDHINGIRSNNRIENLRDASQTQNARSSKRAHGKSRFKGVYVARGGRFGARIKVNGAAIFLGHFPTEEGAARAYDIAAVKHHQEFALTNEKLGKFETPSPIVRAA
jgi:hypothetical protein